MDDDNLGFDLKDNFSEITESTEETTGETTEAVTETTETEEVAENKETTEEVTETTESKADEEVEGKETTEEVTETTETAAETTETKEVEESTKAEERSLNISELTNGRFETAEQLSESLAESDRIQPMTGASVMEQINTQVEERFGEGYTLSDVLTYKSKDFRSMDPFSVIDEHLHLKDPEITDAEIRAEFRPFNLLKKSEAEIERMIEDEEITRDEVEDLEAALSRKVRAAREDLEDFQSELNIDDLEVYAQNQTTEEPNQRSQEDLLADSKRYEAVIENLEARVLEVGTEEDPHQLSFEPDDKDREGVNSFLANDEDGSSWIQKRWMENDGTINMNKLSDDILKMNNYERDMKISFNQGLTKGGSKEVKDISNIDFKEGTQKTTPSDGLSEAAKMVNEWN
jgi:hypothetical protein